MVGGLRGLPAGSVGERTLLGERGWLVEVGSLGLGGGFPVESRRRLERVRQVKDLRELLPGAGQELLAEKVS